MFWCSALFQITVTEMVLFLIQYTSKDLDSREKTIVTGDCCYLNPLVRRTFRFLGMSRPFHFILWIFFMELCAFSPGIQFTVKLWELFGRVLFLSKEREVAPTHIKCTCIKTRYILGYNQWRKAFETLYFILGTVQTNKSYPPLLMTFFCTTQMEKVKRKSLNRIKQAP